MQALSQAQGLVPGVRDGGPVMRRLMVVLRWLYPVGWLEVALNRRLVARAERYMAETVPGSPEEASWIVVTERLRSDADKFRWGVPS